MPTKECAICLEQKVLFQIPQCANVGTHREMCTECCAWAIEKQGKCPLCRAPFDSQIDSYTYEMTCTMDELKNIFSELPQCEQMKLIEHASRSGDMEMVKTIIEIDRSLAVTINSSWTLPHQEAIEKDHVEIMEYLIDVLTALYPTKSQLEVIDLFGENGHNSLALAIDCESDACASRLLELGADPSKKGRGGINAFQTAAGHGRVDFLKEYYHSKKISTQLFVYGCRNSDTLEYFMKEKEVDVTETLEDEGFTWDPLKGLMVSDSEKQLDYVKDFVARGADTSYILTHACVDAGNKEVIRYLVEELGCNPNESYHGRTPLLGVSQRNDVELLKYLLERGANPNEFETVSEIPLHVAARNGYFEMVQTLLNAGARSGIRDVEGFLPLDIAQNEGHEEDAEFLRQSEEENES